MNRDVCSLLIVFLLLSLLALVIAMDLMPQDKPQISNVVTYADGTFGWRTETTAGAAPADVMRATIERMQYEQGTPLGSDRNARALVKAMEALAILEGREVETKDGFPVIE